MCQLLFCNFSKAEINRLYMWNQMLLDAGVNNRDGCGLFNSGKIWKTELDVKIITNMGVCFNTAIKSGPTIGHVRAATVINGKKTVSEASSHPFETKKLVLAHNGSLEFIDPKEHKDYENETVDSVIFMKELSKVYDGTNFLSSIQKTMSKFNGLFAFLIYSKLENKYFVVRGKTKKLHKAIITYTSDGIEQKSLVINTDLADLNLGLGRIKAMLELSGLVSTFSYEKPEELKEETVFEYDGNIELKELGEIKETAKAQQSFFPQTTTNYTGYQRTTYNQTNLITNHPGITIVNTATKTVEQKLITYLDRLNLSLIELDSMIYTQTGKGFFYTTLIELEAFLEATFDTLEALVTNHKMNLWNEICSHYDDRISPYSFNGTKLRFPYMMNGEKALETELLEVKKQDEKARFDF
jgi:predicted glutamine amidotransferase